MSCNRISVKTLDLTVAFSDIVTQLDKILRHFQGIKKRTSTCINAEVLFCEVEAELKNNPIAAHVERLHTFQWMSGVTSGLAIKPISYGNQITAGALYGNHPYNIQQFHHWLVH